MVSFLINLLFYQCFHILQWNKNNQCFSPIFPREFSKFHVLENQIDDCNYKTKTMKHFHFLQILQYGTLSETLLGCLKVPFLHYTYCCFYHIMLWWEVKIEIVFFFNIKLSFSCPNMNINFFNVLPYFPSG